MTETMEEYVQEIEEWIEDVEDPTKGLEDYDFIDRLVHKGSDGNNGLANVGAYLSITEENGEMKVDEELLEEIDERQKESGYGGASRISNIVREGETKKRDGKTLYERKVDGHERLREMVNAYRAPGNLDSPPPSHENILNIDTQNQNSNKSKGGDNNMTDTEYNHQDRTLAGVLSQHDDYSTELVHAAARLERKGVDLIDELYDNQEEYRESGMNKMQAVQSYLDHNADKKLGEVEDLMSSLQNRIDNTDTSNRGNLSTAVEDTVNNITGWDNY